MLPSPRFRPLRSLLPPDPCYYFAHCLEADSGERVDSEARAAFHHPDTDSRPGPANRFDVLAHTEPPDVCYKGKPGPALAVHTYLDFAGLYIVLIRFQSGSNHAQGNERSQSGIYIRDCLVQRGSHRGTYSFNHAHVRPLVIQCCSCQRLSGCTSCIPTLAGTI